MGERIMEPGTPEPPGRTRLCVVRGRLRVDRRVLDHVDGEHLPAVAAAAPNTTLPGGLRRLAV